MVYDAIVVGAAVAGSRTSELLAKDGRDVLLLEDNTEIGVPCKCTGIVSWRIKEVLPNLPKEIVVNTLGRAKFYSPSGINFSLRPRRPVYLLDRPGLDRFLFDQAVKAGAKVSLGERFLEYRKMNGHVKVKTDKGIHRSKILIGSDGANSTVGRQAGFTYPKNFLVGVQTTVTGSFDSTELWFGSKNCPRFFAWLVPENNETARIGLATNPNPSRYYESFLLKRIGRVEKPDVGGIIRFGLMKETAADNVMVVGDAACQVKPYSGGGIIFGLTASEVCASAAMKALDSKNFSGEFLMQNYDIVWKQKLGPAIKRGLALYKILTGFDKFTDFLFVFGKLGSKLFNKLDMDLINYFI